MGLAIEDLHPVESPKTFLNTHCLPYAGRISSKIVFGDFGHEVSMEIQLRQTSGVSVLELKGRLTVNDGVTELRGKVKNLLEEGEHQIVLNLHGVNYMDSTGVDCLVSSYTAAIKLGGEVKFSSLSDRVHRLLDITRLLTVFDTYEDETQAVASFK